MPDLDQAIVDATQAIPGVAVLAVFGSRARGTHRPDSDLDVAVLPVDGECVAESDTEMRRSLQSRLAVALAHLAPQGRVDVVFLDQAPDVLRQRIMEHGRLILCRDPQAWRQLRVRTMREYGDREWVRRRMRAAQRRRLLGGQHHGRPGRALLSLERVGRLPH